MFRFIRTKNDFNLIVREIFSKGQRFVSQDKDTIPILETNIGVPIIVAITKSDLIEQVADSYCNKRGLMNYVPDHFINFVMYNLRRLCLRCKY